MVERAFAIILKRIGFWSGELYRFEGRDSQTSLIPEDNGKKWLLVVGRGHYFESVKDYPIGHQSDLRKLLSNEPWRFPYRGVLLNRVERLSEQSHRVTSWVIKQDVLDSLAVRPLFIIPESVCVEAVLNGSVFVLNRLEQKVHVAVTPDGLLSSLGQGDSFFSRLGPGAALAEQDASVTSVLEGTAAIDIILQGMLVSLKKSMFQFFIGFDRERFHSYSWVNGLKLSAIIGLTYLVMTSGYLLIAKGLVDYRLGANTLKAEPAMLVRNDLNRHRSELTDYKASVTGVYPMWVAWDVLLDLVDLGVSFRAVNSNAPAVTYYMTAVRATDILRVLSEDPRVIDAEFALPVRNVGQKEQFAIKVTFREVPLNIQLEPATGG